MLECRLKSHSEVSGRNPPPKGSVSARLASQELERHHVTPSIYQCDISRQHGTSVSMLYQCDSPKSHWDTINRWNLEMSTNLFYDNNSVKLWRIKQRMMLNYELHIGLKTNSYLFDFFIFNTNTTPVMTFLTLCLSYYVNKNLITPCQTLMPIQSILITMNRKMKPNSAALNFPTQETALHKRFANALSH